MLTINDIAAMKRSGEKIACLTAYDASFATVIDKVGVEIILVGDSLGMVVQGHPTTVPVTLENMVYHTQCVSRAVQYAYLIADLSFMTYSNLADAAQNAARLMQQGGAHMVKLEGPRFACITHLVEQGIPVCGHLGLLPQSIHQLGGYAVQGKLPQDAGKIQEQAVKLQEAGASMLVLECVPSDLAAMIANTLTIPVIGIGAGVGTDGQVLVLHDMLGMGKRLKFSKDFLAGQTSIESAIRAYYQAVKKAEFPGSDHSF